VAYRLLQTDTLPSWLYFLKYNATTIWETWNGWNGPQGPGLSSFNHYALGSVGQWLYQSVAGIDTDNTEVGFKKIVIKPHPGEGLTYVTAEYKSINGLIKTHWETKGTEFDLKVKQF
jgi:alpha-L-rhamnosidase